MCTDLQKKGPAGSLDIMDVCENQESRGPNIYSNCSLLNSRNVLYSWYNVYNDDVSYLLIPILPFPKTTWGHHLVGCPTFDRIPAPWNAECSKPTSPRTMACFFVANRQRTCCRTTWMWLLQKDEQLGSASDALAIFLSFWGICVGCGPWDKRELVNAHIWSILVYLACNSMQ